MNAKSLENTVQEDCVHSRFVVVCEMQKQWKGKAARSLANLAAFESLAKMAEEPW